MNLGKVFAATAATFVLLAGSLVWAQPAQAAPGEVCSVEVWQSPGNWSDCIKRTREALDAKTACVAAPAPGSPTSGLAGMFAAEPDSAKRDGVQGQYSLYGVGGYGLDTYALGCLEKGAHPDLVMWNTGASAEFKGAAAILGSSNSLRDLAYEPASMWDWSDQLVTNGTKKIYEYVFNVFGAVTIVVAGLFLVWTSRQGRLPKVMQMIGWMVFVSVLTSLVAYGPLQAVRHLDKGASAALSAMHSLIGPGPVNVAADKCVLSAESCKDNRTVSTRASDVATEAILYRSWVRAVLGDNDSEVARKYGPALYDATAMSWGEAARVEQNPALRQALIDQKAQAWNTLAQQIATEDPTAFEHMQGIHGADRFGMGAFAVLSALVFSLFDSAASLVILFGFGIFRVTVLLLPLVATFGLFQPAGAGVRRVINATAAALFNIGLFGAAAGGYLAIADGLFSSGLPGIAQVVLLGLLGVAGVIVLRPIGMIVSTGTGRSRGKESMITRAWRNVKDAADERGITVGFGPGAPVKLDGAPPRPETASTRPRTVRRVAEVLAPTAFEAAQHPITAAGVEAARSRPEGGRAVDAARAVAVAVGAAAHQTVTAAIDNPPAAASRPETAPRS